MVSLPYRHTNLPQVYLQMVAGCAFLALIIMFQPAHHKIILLDKGVPRPDMDPNGPPPQEVAALQGTQAGALVAADAADASAAAEATAAATAATELVPLVLLKQKPSSKGHVAPRMHPHAVPQKQLLRDVEAVEHLKLTENRKRQMRIRQAQIQRQQKLKHDLQHLI